MINAAAFKGSASTINGLESSSFDCNSKCKKVISNLALEGYEYNIQTVKAVSDFFNRKITRKRMEEIFDEMDRK